MCKLELAAYEFFFNRRTSQEDALGHAAWLDFADALTRPFLRARCDLTSYSSPSSALASPMV